MHSTVIRAEGGSRACAVRAAGRRPVGPVAAGSDRAAGAQRLGAAVPLGVFDDQRVVLVEHRVVGGERGLEKGLDFSVSRAFINEPDPVQDAARVCIDDKNRNAEGVEQYRISGLRPDAPLRQKLVA